MKKIACFILILIMTLTLTPCALAEGESVTDTVAAFIKEHGTNIEGTDNIWYSAEMKGGGSFSINIVNGKIACWIDYEETNGEEYDYYEFTMLFKEPFDARHEWSCIITDENGINAANGTVGGDDDCTTELVSDEYVGDEYLYDSFMSNAQNFRDTLILAIANDLNYYFDKNLDYFGLNEQFLCPDGHTFGDWVYQQNAGYDKNGTEKRQCDVCFATQEREKEGTRITMPDGTLIDPETKLPITDTPDTEVDTTIPTPDTQPDTTPIPTPETEPSYDDIPQPDIEFELEPEPEPEPEPEKEKKPLPAYAIPLIIVIVVAVAATATAFVLISKRSKKEDDEPDVFTPDDD